MKCEREYDSEGTHIASTVAAKSSLRSSLTLLQSIWEGEGEIKIAWLND